MSTPSPRRRFWTYMAAIFALVFLVIALLRVAEMVRDPEEEGPPAAAA